jgi:deoxyribonuclease-4
MAKPTPGRRVAGRIVGAHQSIAGGFVRAVERAVETGCDALQVFTRNVNRWAAEPIPPADAAAFRRAVRDAGLACVVAHDSYLINPASADDVLREKSIAGLVTEIERAEELGIPWVVAHPGAAGDQPRDEAVRRAAEGIAAALDRTRGRSAGILVETTAGQGSCLGDTFAEIGAILAIVDAAAPGGGPTPRAAVCLDTCHVFAAGYGLAPAAELDRTLADFDAAIGLGRLRVIHANDSKRERGSRVDRHEAIGRGEIGPEAFRLIMRHPLLAGIPLILETPKEGPDGKVCPDNDRANLATLRGFEPRTAGRRRTGDTAP